MPSSEHNHADHEGASCCSGGSCSISNNSKKSAKKRKLTYCFLVLIAIFVIALSASEFFLGRVIKSGVEIVGSQVTQSSITVDNIDLSLLRGRLAIDNLVLGNPEGYKTDSAISLGKVLVQLSPRSLFSDTIQIQEITIDAPQITYERSLTNSNIGKIQDHVKEFLPESDKDDKDKRDKEKDDKPSKKVIIDQVSVTNGQINLSATILQGKALPVMLPPVSMQDIGKEKQVNTVEASAEILHHVLTSVITVATDAIKSLGTSLGDLLKSDDESSLKSKAKEAKQEVKEAASNLKEAGKGLLQGLTGDKTETKK